METHTSMKTTSPNKEDLHRKFMIVDGQMCEIFEAEGLTEDDFEPEEPP